MFGNPETTTGGRALKFYASVRLDVRRVEALKWKDIKGLLCSNNNLKDFTKKKLMMFDSKVFFMSENL